MFRFGILFAHSVQYEEMDRALGDSLLDRAIRHCPVCRRCGIRTREDQDCERTGALREYELVCLGCF